VKIRPGSFSKEFSTKFGGAARTVSSFTTRKPSRKKEKKKMYWKNRFLRTSAGEEKRKVPLKELFSSFTLEGGEGGMREKD